MPARGARLLDQARPEGQGLRTAAPRRRSRSAGSVSDKVAVVCSASSSCSWSCSAIFAPVDQQRAADLRDISDPRRARRTATVLDFDGYPIVGPPLHAFTWDHPLGHRARHRLRQPGPPAATACAPRCSSRPSRPRSFSTLIGVVARPGRRLLARLAGPDHLVRHRPVPVASRSCSARWRWRRSSSTASASDADSSGQGAARRADRDPGDLRLDGPGPADPRPGAVAARARVHPGRRR